LLRSLGWIEGSGDLIDLRLGGTPLAATTSDSGRGLDLTLNVVMNSDAGKTSAAVKKIGVVMKRLVVEMKRGDRQIRSASASKSVEDLRSVVALMKIASERPFESLRRRRGNAPLPRGFAKRRSCALEIAGLTVLKWFLVILPTKCLLVLQM
jgi:hypothetical protein